MLFSRLALLFVLAEWGCILYGFFGQSSKMLFHMFIYGSPLYMVMNAFTSGSVFLDTQKFFIVLLAFHILKYITIFKAQISDDRNFGLMTAIVLEVIYIGYSGYLLYS